MLDSMKPLLQLWQMYSRSLENNSWNCIRYKNSMAISWNILPNYEGVLDKAKKVEFYPEYTPFQNPIPKHCTSMQKVEMIWFSATIFPHFFGSLQLKISKKHIVKNDAKCCDEQRILCRPIWNTLFYESCCEQANKHHPVNHLVKTRMKSHEKKSPFFLRWNQTIIKNYYCYVNPLKCSWWLF